ncbi:putative invertase inhibitor [Cucumis melo var. makuwa]|uniref:Invertase inhibitor n=1 Tax=Cucumis melo var. makuwa TaxID=1194695 RepID=A0A5A7TCY0_CUCMM|nr:putative invertase inhibitor [Cucumis melo var. makuwa]TYK24547.1 putative invertase inhibitor [Cucumis melo var. makuwa]
MAIPHYFSVFILSIFFFSNFLIIQSSKTIKTADLIYKTCKKISREDPNISFNFCLTSLKLATNHSRCTDVRHLGLLSIGLLYRNVTSTCHHITKLVKNKKLDPFVKSCLDDCLELYSDAIPTVKQAMRDYKSKRYDDVNVAIGSVMDAATTCEDGFKERKGVASPLKKRDENAFELGAIVLSIMSLVR